MTIAEWLKDAANDLADELLPSARLDAEIILAHTLKKPRTHLHAHADDPLSARDEDIANARIAIRKDRVPVAYIIGHKDFYGRRFSVTPSVLIPRPESEQLITMLKELLPTTKPLPGIASKRLVDLGTGSGCLGITAKLELPELSVALTDINRHTLKVAAKNAATLGADVETFQSDLLNGYPYAPDIILANLPYVDRAWEHLSPELASEPDEALYADDGGLAIIKRCIEQVSLRAKPGALLLLEADTRQLDDIARAAAAHGFKEVARDSYAIGLRLG
jgi:release factor glutamine methyltransferase